MVTGHRPDSVRAQKLNLVKHAGQNPPQPLRADQGGDTAPPHAKMRWSRRVDAIELPRHSPQPLPEERQQMRYLLPLPGLDHGRRTNWQQTHHGADLESGGASIRESQDIGRAPDRDTATNRFISQGTLALQGTENRDEISYRNGTGSKGGLP